MLSWNVYIGNVNTSEIEVYNIFSHGSFYEKLCKLAKDFRKQLKDETKTVAVGMWEPEKGSFKKDIPVKDHFFNEVRSNLMYYFWSKCEWEIVITDWPRSEVSIKVDAYKQVMNNWDVFKEYLMNHLKEITPKNKPTK